MEHVVVFNFQNDNPARKTDLFWAYFEGMFSKSFALVGSLFLSLLLIENSYSAVLATVNGKNITDQDIKNAVSRLNASQQSEILRSKLSKIKILDSLIEQALLTDEANAKRIGQRREYEQIVKNFKKQAKINLLIRMQVDRKVTEKSARAYYEKHKIEFRTDQVRASHILVKDLKKADRVAALARKKGNKFEDLVKKYSEDLSKKINKGNLGYFPRDRFEPGFRKPVFKALEGEIVGPLATSFGFHIVKVVAKEAGSQIPFKNSEIKARAALKQELLRKYLWSLRKKAKVKIHHKRIK